MGRIIRSPEAQSDVDEISLYIARDSLDAALR
jgi:plasmid stabilization system protein ParE